MAGDETTGREIGPRGEKAALGLPALGPRSFCPSARIGLLAILARQQRGLAVLQLDGADQFDPAGFVFGNGAAPCCGPCCSANGASPMQFRRPA